LKDLTVLFETGKGNKRVAWILVNLQIHSHPHYAHLYAFSGYDSCSAFKVAPIKLLKKSVHFQEVLCKLGE